MTERKLNKSLDDIIKENAKGASKGAPRRGKVCQGCFTPAVSVVFT